MREWMMPVLTEDILGQVVRAIVREVDPDEIYFFGSHARGEARADSDLDLLIVESQAFADGQERWRHLSRIREALSEVPFPKDLLLFGADEVAYWRGSPGHLIGTCLREGRRLYARHQAS